jgi:3-dehydroquinate synthase
VFDLSIQFETCVTQTLVRLNALRDVGALLRAARPSEPGLRVLVLTDERVGDLYGETVLESLEDAAFEAREHRIRPGEASKSLEVLGDVYQSLVRFELDRDGQILALGGGVVSDLAGFAAATWMRGVGFAVCPTTLEADVDASIGGKTAINVPGAKNLVGAFHQPALVAVDPSCLQTLERRDIRAGMAESVKHALITSEEFLEWHEAGVERLSAVDLPLMRELILRNLRVKAAIVQRDPCEHTGRRIILNFGHTIGHAIEECTGFALRHGECVSLGMLVACRLSQALGLLEDDGVVGRLAKLLTRLGLPTQLAEPIEADRIMATLRRDKKVWGGQERFVLLEDVGRPVVRGDVPEGQVREAYESLLP